MTGLCDISARHVSIDAIFRVMGLSGVLPRLRDRVLGRDDCYVAGGAVRDSILGITPKDIDLVATPESGVLDSFLMLPFLAAARQNRHGNWRFSFDNGRHIDLILTDRFYGSSQTPHDVLSFFDASVNAVGLSLYDGAFIDPINGLDDLLRGQIRLPQKRWSIDDDFELVHQALRLCRLVEKTGLTVERPDQLSAAVRKFDVVDWSDLERLNGFGRNEAADKVALIQTGLFRAD